MATDSWIAGRVIPTYGARQIAAPWPDPFVTDKGGRRWAQNKFLQTPDAELRERLADDYALRWVLDVPGFLDLDITFGKWKLVEAGPDGSRLLARSTNPSGCETDGGSHALSAP